MGTAVLEIRFRGCSQALLYNEIRPHSSLGHLTPREFIAKLSAQAATSAPATGRDAALPGASAPRPVASPSREGQQKPAEEVPVSS